MSEKKCSTCLFGDKCDGMKLCSDYFPITDDAVTECEIEDNRCAYEEYKVLWNEYINDFNS